MRAKLLLAAAFAALCLPAAATAQSRAKPSITDVPKRPGPVAADWRTPDANDVLVIDTNKGRIVLEMIPEAAPLFVQRVRELALEHFYDGHTFFRVIEDFMDQTGDPLNTGEGGSTRPDVPGEFTFRRGPETAFVTAADQSIAEVGFIKSLPVMSQSMMLAPMTRDGKVSAWGLFCPGVAGAARAESPDSANSQFFLMRAGYPSLEKRYAAWGRVISGQDVVRAIKVGEPVADPQDRMERVRVLADIPAAERPKVRVIDPKSAWFKGEIDRVRATKGADFSACDVNIPAEVK
ncbi:peptidylprolyl isomerase [Phenylobacterium deserti]|uniref:peptidylprolyl isomerase n=1 Tax=Phenylobacterium deserti TaxID=1914756 RepID=A0A328ADG6_9CAUL|nr:peptidylprolyl isomerase [Phenylobacterium deserti]RAK52266.1 peptidylprolyl isomerase [Phenylobacterium deserti]